MKYEERERLLKVAAGYKPEELQLFIDETGWEDWMNDYTEAEEGDPISDRDCSAIDEILTEIFNEAHPYEEEE